MYSWPCMTKAIIPAVAWASEEEMSKAGCREEEGNNRFIMKCLFYQRRWNQSLSQHMYLYWCLGLSSNCISNHWIHLIVNSFFVSWLTTLKVHHTLLIKHLGVHNGYLMYPVFLGTMVVCVFRINAKCQQNAIKHIISGGDISGCDLRSTTHKQQQ